MRKIALLVCVIILASCASVPQKALAETNELNEEQQLLVDMAVAWSAAMFGVMANAQSFIDDEYFSLTDPVVTSKETLGEQRHRERLANSWNKILQVEKTVLSAIEVILHHVEDNKEINQSTLKNFIIDTKKGITLYNQWLDCVTEFNTVKKEYKELRGN
jgi:hypothetical protein